MCVTIFIEIMHVGAPVAIMQVVFSAVHYADNYLYCNYTGDCSVVAMYMYVTVSNGNFIIFSLTDTHFS